MRKKLFIAVSLLVASNGFTFAQDKSADLAIVVNPDCSLDNVSSEELTKIFKAEKNKTPDGVKFVITGRSAGSTEQNASLKGIYQLSDAEYNKFFLQATFAGTIPAAPKQLPSGSAVCQFVAAEKGGIGYLCATEADATVKVIKVDGKAPGDPGYPIKIK
jgi:hypothetical protein